MFSKLYGDGIHDDTSALQELIDSGICELCLPVPEKFYLISKPLELPSNFKLKLPRYAKVKLAANSNCVMIKNKTLTDRKERIADKGIYDFVNEYSPDFPCENIAVEGGIWDLNNKEQAPNPIITKGTPAGYNGFIMLFYNVKNLEVTNMTFKDPVTYAVLFDRVTYFTVDNIVFDFNYGNPLATNMDGIHLNGNCHYGSINNLKGACYDDLVALNADEGSCGEITNVEINGLFAEDCHSAVRLLSANQAVKNIHISNVFGTYFQYCIGITRFFPTNDKGFFDAITLDNIYASKAERKPVYNKKPEDYVFSVIYIADKLRVKQLKISDLCRREYINNVATIRVREESIVENMILSNISTENHTGSETMPLLENFGEIKVLSQNMIFAEGKQVEV